MTSDLQTQARHCLISFLPQHRQNTSPLDVCNRKINEGGLYLANLKKTKRNTYLWPLSFFRHKHLQMVPWTCSFFLCRDGAQGAEEARGGKVVWILLLLFLALLGIISTLSSHLRQVLRYSELKPSQLLLPLMYLHVFPVCVLCRVP